MLKKIALLLIWIYQNFISRFTKARCRFKPTCSEYTKQAIQKYGFFKGVKIGYRRLKRCVPDGPKGYDPVP